MRQLLCYCIIATLLFPSCAFAQEKQIGQPHKIWKTGDSWVLREYVPIGRGSMYPSFTFQEDTTNDVVFKVLGKKEIRGMECFEIEVSAPPEPAETTYQSHRKLIYYTCETGLPVRMTSARIDKTGKEELLPQGITLDPNDPHVPMGFEPYLFPFWDKENSAQKELSAAQRYVLSQEKLPAAGAPDTIKFIIKGNYWVKEGSTLLTQEFRQTWKRGEPWWHEMYWYEFGNLHYKAVLLPETIGASNNQPRANRPKHPNRQNAQ
jgi:hypothetical protein